MKLLVVLPFCQKDSKLALDLLTWIAELGKWPDNPLLLVADSRLTKLDWEAHAKVASTIFKSVAVISTPFALPDEKWPIGANWSFETAAKHISLLIKQPWLWLEPDATPLKSGWLGEIEAEYEKAGKLFMGKLFQPKTAGLPIFMMSGVGVYPPELPKRMFQRLVSQRGKAWDVSCADLIVPQSHHSTLFWNFHNSKLQPTFMLKKREDSPVNAIALDDLPLRAVIAHCCKDGSLIRCLQRRMAKEKPIQIEAELVTTEAEIAVSSKPRIFHVFEEHTDKDERTINAQNTWKTFYRHKQFYRTPLENYPRSSLLLGDSRCLPYLKDVLRRGMMLANRNDIILFTNGDIVLHPQFDSAIRNALETQPCVTAFRIEVDSIPDLNSDPADLAVIGSTSYGRDIFAFRNLWLMENWADIPDFLVGELEWDLVLALMVRSANGIETTAPLEISQLKPPAELPNGYVFHVKHTGRWLSNEFQSSPAKQHNIACSRDWHVRHNTKHLFAFC